MSHHISFYTKPCPCEEGLVRWESWERYSNWGGIEHDPREILCEKCKETHEIRNVESYDRKTGESYSFVRVVEKTAS